MQIPLYGLTKGFKTCFDFKLFYHCSVLSSLFVLALIVILILTVYYVLLQEVPVCDHPLADISIAGRSVEPLPETFHTLLQSIADVTMSLPIGSVIQVGHRIC